MKIYWLLPGCLVFIFFNLGFCGSHACAQDFSSLNDWGVSLGRGQSSDKIDIYRVGLIRQWDVKWFENKTGYLGGYFELSYNRWTCDSDAINAVALSPVFRYSFNPNGATSYPYIEAGIGVTYLDRYLIHNRNLSTNFVFEDRIGCGIRVRNVDINFRYMHYSNADLEQPNDGIDILIGSVSWLF